MKIDNDALVIAAAWIACGLGALGGYPESLWFAVVLTIIVAGS